MKVSSYIRGIVERSIESRRVVVWYDPTRSARAVFDSISGKGLVKLDAATSPLQARRAADDAWRKITGDPSTSLLVYVPWPRAQDEKERTQEPFEALSIIGCSFGVDPAETTESLARAAIPTCSEEIDRLFKASPPPTLAQLDSLGEKAGYPLLKQAFGTEDAIEVGVQILAAPERAAVQMAPAGVRHQLESLLRDAFGFAAAPDPALLSGAFGQWVLFSEFVFDVPDVVPAHATLIARAPAVHQPAVFRLCERLRSSDDARDAYVRMARDIEARLRLGGIAQDDKPYGRRDTFPAEDRAALKAVLREATAGDADRAREILVDRARSIWRLEGDRDQLWRIAERCLDLLDAATAWETRAVADAAAVREHVFAYRAPDGLWRVDQRQRLMEQLAGDADDRDVVQPLLDHARRRHRAVTERAQKSFLSSVLREGWPPDLPQQTQIFKQHVEPALGRGQRVAYFLLDALRYEMGCDLKDGLEKLGEATIHATMSVVPTSTPFGMAALMPGAEVGVGCDVIDGALVPMIGNAALPGVGERKAWITARYGDRAVDLRLDSLIDVSKEGLRHKIGRADLLIVRSDDIDKAGEEANLPSARRFMTTIIEDVVRVTHRLAQAGITTFVYAADHGHVLLPDVPPGDVLSAPAGTWPFAKRRCKLGTGAGRTPGVEVVKSSFLGLHGPVQDIAVATGFRVFKSGANFFHEGMSLQECLIPAVTLSVRGAPSASGGAVVVNISYRSDRVTSRVFSVKLGLQSTTLFGGPDSESVRIEAWSTSEPPRKVGAAADCEDRDPSTGVITVYKDQNVQVPVKIDADDPGAEIEVRAYDAGGLGMVLGSKKFKNALME